MTVVGVVWGACETAEQPIPFAEGVGLVEHLAAVVHHVGNARKVFDGAEYPYVGGEHFEVVYLGLVAPLEDRPEERVEPCGYVGCAFEWRVGGWGSGLRASLYVDRLERSGLPGDALRLHDALLYLVHYHH